MVRNYERTSWRDRIQDAQGNIIEQGTPLSAGNMMNIENGIELSHIDIGLLAAFLSQQQNLNTKELVKWKSQRVMQGTAVITSSASGGYLRTSDPFVQVALTGFAQINAPNYTVILSPTSGDTGLAGELEVYDKTQNGFKVRMTGSAPSIGFMWTLINPSV